MHLSGSNILSTQSLVYRSPAYIVSYFFLCFTFRHPEHKHTHTHRIQHYKNCANKIRTTFSLLSLHLYKEKFKMYNGKVKKKKSFKN